jgi:hypothetical protein
LPFSTLTGPVERSTTITNRALIRPPEAFVRMSASLNISTWPLRTFESVPRASLVVQQVVGIVTEPVLVPPGEEGVLEAAHDARVLVVGLSDRWRTEGIGRVRLAVAAGVDVPTLFVRRGLRPSGVAPSETLTRFTWTLASQQHGTLH